MIPLLRKSNFVAYEINNSVIHSKQFKISMIVASHNAIFVQPLEYEIEKNVLGLFVT